ncbi:junctional adhesion molecule A-like [Platysternon megacephalum]|uniref:Junctional adhesion molecule A-like n=1 Tax=Platysternon megacephalum TaxID=55544 RepID=A0A4D9DJV7_9SAUR|nr:junctional adhesion molecule A-like [Platysternon megacephalum]
MLITDGNKNAGSACPWRGASKQQVDSHEQQLLFYGAVSLYGGPQFSCEQIPIKHSSPRAQAVNTAINLLPQDMLPPSPETSQAQACCTSTLELAKLGAGQGLFPLLAMLKAGLLHVPSHQAAWDRRAHPALKHPSGFAAVPQGANKGSK